MLSVLLGALAAGYGAYALLLSRGFVKPRRAARKVETRKAGNQDDWLKGTNFNKVLACCPPCTLQCCLSQLAVSVLS